MKHYCNKCGNRVFKEDLDDKGFCRDCTEDLHRRTRIVTREEIKKRDEYYSIMNYLSDVKDHTYDHILIPIIASIVTALVLIFKVQTYPDAHFLIVLLGVLLLSGGVGLITFFLYSLSIFGIKLLWGKIANNFESSKAIKIITFFAVLLIMLVISLIITVKSQL